MEKKKNGLKREQGDPGPRKDIFGEGARVRGFVNECER